MNNNKTLPPTPWRETSLFKNLKEVTREGYEQMKAYEAAGGVLDSLDIIAKKYFEKHYRKTSENKHQSNNEY